MNVPPAFRPRVIRNPAVAQTQPGSIFTPAIAAWSNPGQLGGLGDLSIGGVTIPAWAGYVVAGLFLLLALRKKIPWWAGLAGAGAAWYYLVNTGPVSTSVTTGVGIVPSGTTIQFSVNSPGMLTGTGNSATMTVGGVTYPVLQTAANSDGTTTYYLDNPTPVVAATG